MRLAILTVLASALAADAAQQPCGTEATARELNPRLGQVDDDIDSTAQRGTCWWHLGFEAGGWLRVKFDNFGSKLSADFVPRQGAPEKIDPIAGLYKPDLPGGDYYVKVYANEPGAAGRYRLQTDSARGDFLDTPEMADELKSPSDSRIGELDVSRGKQFQFYRFSAKEKGKLTISFKVLHRPRGSKMAAFFMKAADDAEGEKIPRTPLSKEIDPGDVYIRVQAPGPGDSGKYELRTTYQPQH
jgi:hypothetical protein